MAIETTRTMAMAIRWWASKRAMARVARAMTTASKRAKAMASRAMATATKRAIMTDGEGNVDNGKSNGNNDK